MPTNSTARVLLLAEGTAEAASLDHLIRKSGLPEDTATARLTEGDADAVAAALPDLLDGLADLEIAVLMGALASETWRRHPAFQLHLTLVETPSVLSDDPADIARVEAALTGVAAMLT